MTNYIGLDCPVCGKKFTADDDIVVCPQCGAPYHRDCYEAVGDCVYKEKHGTPDAWSPPKTEEEDAGEKKRCPRCGYLNRETALFCEHCGQPLSMNNTAPQENAWNRPPYGPQAGSPFGQGRPGDYRGNGNPQGNGNYPGDGNYRSNDNGPGNGGYPGNGNYQNNGNYPPPPGTYPPPPGYPAGPMPYPFDPMGGINPNEQLDGVAVSDLAKYVQSNTQYYLPVFMNQKRFRRNRFNFCAFLFPGAWMLYRKLYKLGAVVTSVTFLVYIAYAYVNLNVLSPIFATLMQQAGITPDTLSLTNAQVQRLSDAIFALPAAQIVLLTIPFLVFAIQLVIMLVSGFVANRVYLKRCLSRVGAIRRETEKATEAAIRLQEEGGVNLPLGVCIGLCYLILTYIPQIFF